MPTAQVTTPTHNEDHAEAVTALVRVMSRGAIKEYAANVSAARIAHAKPGPSSEARPPANTRVMSPEAASPSPMRTPEVNSAPQLAVFHRRHEGWGKQQYAGGSERCTSPQSLVVAHGLNGIERACHEREA